MAGGSTQQIDLGYPFDINDKSIEVTCDYQCHLENSIQAIYPGTDWANGKEFAEIAVEGGNIVQGYDPQGAKISILYSLDKTREWMYVHLSKQVKFGLVKKGDLIGYAGSTGLSTGNHLHLGLRIAGQFIDPDKYIKDHYDNLPFTQAEMDEIIKQVKWSTIQSNLKSIEHMDILGDTWIETRLIRSDELSQPPYENIWYISQTRYSYDAGKTWTSFSGSGALSSDLTSHSDGKVVTQFALDTQTNSIMRYTKGAKNVFTNWQTF